jgi:hypothetical protein
MFDLLLFFVDDLKLGLYFRKSDKRLFL